MAFNVLFVCTGNTCRSPMAEGLLRSQWPATRRSGFTVASAGTVTVRGLPVSFEAAEVMREAGIDISGHAAQPLTDALIDKADLILALAQGHLGQIRDRFPSAEGKAFLLSTYADKKGPARDVPDPAGEDLAAYRTVRDQISRYTRAIAEKM
ncbi:MAG: low molecular weight protein arginine phosphatase [Fibrobacterota bacterium]